jgi:CubicO group peptidase (beta-lactamase class C family)
VTTDLLADFIRANTEADLGVYGIQAQRDGQPPIAHRFRSDDRVNLYSVSKGFTAVALGLAEAEGRLSLDDRLLDHFPELAPEAADGVERITLYQLLTMSSGSSHEWFADRPIHAPDLLAEIVAAPLVAEPGTRFNYTGSGPYAAARALARATGANVRDYLLPRLFTPLGLLNPQWLRCPLGYPTAESDLLLRTEELGRFALLLVREGTWTDGRQLIPAEFVRRMGTDVVDCSTGPARPSGEPDERTYGLGVWPHRAGRYQLHGRYGQFAIIDPRRRAAVTCTAHTEREDALMDALHDLVLDRMG